MTNKLDTSKESANYDVASHIDFHVFSFKDKYFFYDINNVKAFEINDKLFYKLISNRNDSDLFRKLLQSLHIKDEHKDQLQSYSRGLMTISLNVAQVCNLSCVYCYGIDGEYGTKGKMNEITAFSSVDFLFNLSIDSTVCIHFFGGEPLLNFPLMKKVVHYSIEKANKNNKTIVFSITTNGTKFSTEVNAFLNKNDFNVIISFDGDEEMQDKNRPYKNGGGSYATIKPKVEEFLKSRNGNASARATVTNHSYDLKKLKKGLKEMGFRNAAATVATLSDFAIENRPVDKLDEIQKSNILLEVDNESDELLIAIKNKNIEALNNLSDSDVITYITQLNQKQKKYFACGVGRGLLAISIEGNIYPCHRFVGNDEFKMGHIDTYDKSAATQYEKSYTQTHPVCSKCWAKYHCGGIGCLHDNYTMKGHIENVNIDHCTRLKNELKNAIYILSSLNADDKEFLSAPQNK